MPRYETLHYGGEFATMLAVAAGPESKLQLRLVGQKTAKIGLCAGPVPTGPSGPKAARGVDDARQRPAFVIPRQLSFFAYARRPMNGRKSLGFHAP
jgi:hypothetical protein